MNQIVKPSPLGRGLSALFGDADASYQSKPVLQRVGAGLAAEPVEIKKGAVHSLALAWLQPGAYQPRRHFAEDSIKELADSIRERGILEPLLVRPVTGMKDAYEIIAGERRWRAAQLIGLHEVPVVVREITDREALEFGLIENIQRQDLSLLEEAEGYQRLISEFQHTQENLAKIIGKSRPHITNMLRLLTLPKDVRDLLESGALTMGHARALIPARDPSALAREIVAKGLNVRQAEALAKQNIDNPQTHKKKITPENADVHALEQELGNVVGLRVKIHSQGKEGSLTLYYKDLDQLDGVIGRLRQIP